MLPTLGLPRAYHSIQPPLPQHVRRRTKRHPSKMTKNWIVYKDTIIKLYKTENMTLNQVKEIMNREHHFDAG